MCNPFICQNTAAALWHPEGSARATLANCTAPFSFWEGMSEDKPFTCMICSHIFRLWLSCKKKNLILRNQVLWKWQWKRLWKGCPRSTTLLWACVHLLCLSAMPCTPALSVWGPARFWGARIASAWISTVKLKRDFNYCHTSNDDPKTHGFSCSFCWMQCNPWTSLVVFYTWVSYVRFD